MTFAFLVHPRADLRQDMARLAKPLGLVPNIVYDHALRRLPLSPLRFASVDLGGREVGRLILVPFGARHLLADRRAGARKVAQAVDLAAATGADLVGLGGLTSPVTNGGRQLMRRNDIGVTNGNAFTAATVHRQVRSILATAPTGRVAVVGATGSVGSAVTRLLARDGLGADLLLVARDRSRLDPLADAVGARTAIDLPAVATCDVVVLLTSAADALIGPAHLGDGAVVLDATQPRNSGPELLRRRPDVRVLDGGVVDVPGLRLRGGSIGLAPGQAFACLAETMLLSLHGHRGHFSLGRPTLEQVDRMVEIADEQNDLGFRPAAPSSFGRPVDPLAPGSLAPTGPAVQVVSAGAVAAVSERQRVSDQDVRSVPLPGATELAKCPGRAAAVSERQRVSDQDVRSVPLPGATELAKCPGRAAAVSERQRVSDQDVRSVPLPGATELAKCPGRAAA